MTEKILITCRDATNFISQREEGKISLSHHVKLVIHLLICKFCKLFYRQNEFLVKSVRNLSSDDSLTKDEQAVLIRAIEDNSIQE